MKAVLLFFLLLCAPQLHAATAAEPMCQQLLSDIYTDLRAIVDHQWVLIEDDVALDIGRALSRLTPNREINVPFLTDTQLKKRFPEIPAEELSTIAAQLRAYGGGILQIPSHLFDSTGEFWVSEQGRPILCLANPPQHLTNAARANWEHQRSHFLLWKNLVDARIVRGESHREAGRNAAALLSSPQGLLVDEAHALLAELPWREDYLEVQHTAKLVELRNQIFLAPLQRALVMTQLLPSLGLPEHTEARVTKSLSRSSGHFRRQVITRTRQWRATLAQRYREWVLDRQPRTELAQDLRDALADLAPWITPEHHLDLSLLKLPVQMLLLSIQLEQDPARITDYFGPIPSDQMLEFDFIAAWMKVQLR